MFLQLSHFAFSDQAVSLEEQCDLLVSFGETTICSGDKTTHQFPLSLFQTGIKPKVTYNRAKCNVSEIQCYKVQIFNSLFAYNVVHLIYKFIFQQCNTYK